MMLRVLIFAAAFSLMCEPWQHALGAALREEARRFPGPHITKQQWQTFFDETRFKRYAMVVRELSLTRVLVPRETAVYLFTRKSHPAHPAVVRRALVSQRGKLYIHTSGYYAGDREAFRMWLNRLVDGDRYTLMQVGWRARLDH